MTSRVHKSASGLLNASLAVAIVGLIGCFGGHGGEEQPHAEHVIPAHKPADFPEAVNQIVVRTAEPISDAAAVQELQDIVGWLPELAAQTDLPRADWDRIHEISIRWGQREWTVSTDGTDAYADELNLLQELAEKAKQVDTFNTYRTEGEEHV